jgi:uncharacterized SAM-binding protein YcdF (DUF218 family)
VKSNKSSRWALKPSSISRVLQCIGASAIALFLVSAYTPAWNWVAGAISIAPLEAEVSADAVVVLGAGVMADTSLSDESLQRAIHGIKVFKKGGARTLVMSGPRRIPLSPKSEAEVRRDLAVAFGVPVKQIAVVDEARTTREEAQHTVAITSGPRLRTVLLVTSSLHMRRARGVFQKAGLTVFPSPSDNLATAAGESGERLELMKAVIQEIGALIYYAFAGYT